ncbi:hypothetical protein HK104_007795, partial [Borealophlyctis nickersoniae]
EGEVALIRGVSKGVVMATSKGFVKLFDTERREPKCVGNKFVDMDAKIHSITSIHANSTLSMVTFLARVFVE